MTSASSSFGIGGGLVSISSMIPISLARIFLWSAQASRTSASTRATSAASASRRSGSMTRSTSAWMKDSRWASAAPSGAMPVSVPCSSRCTATIGWTMRCSVRPCRLTSIETESTRNGMSSLTISMTVCVDCQPSPAEGLNTRTRAWPGSRLRAKFQCESAAPYMSAGERSSRSSGSTCLKYRATKRSRTSRSVPPARCPTRSSTSSTRVALAASPFIVIKASAPSSRSS